MLPVHAYHHFTARTRRIKRYTRATPEAAGVGSGAPTKDCRGAGIADSRVRRGWNPDHHAHADTIESHGDVERGGRRSDRASRVDFSVTDNDGGGGGGPRGKSTCPVA